MDSRLHLCVDSGRLALRGSSHRSVLTSCGPHTDTNIVQPPVHLMGESDDRLWNLLASREFNRSSKRETAMRVFLGMILGVLLTFGVAFVYDSGTGRAPNGLTVASAEGHAPVVNWDIVSHDMEGVKQRLREVAVDVERGWKRMTG
jgi:hypothetical protein